MTEYLCTSTPQISISCTQTPFKNYRNLAQGVWDWPHQEAVLTLTSMLTCHPHPSWLLHAASMLHMPSQSRPVPTMWGREASRAAILVAFKEMPSAYLAPLKIWPTPTSQVSLGRLQWDPYLCGTLDLRAQRKWGKSKYTGNVAAVQSGWVLEFWWPGFQKKKWKGPEGNLGFKKNIAEMDVGPSVHHLH